MTRPLKQRSIGQPPEVVIYKPAGIPARELEWVTLTLDEFEAVRLIDELGNDQESAAQTMGVSRPTVTRIYQAARKKIANVLVNGKALRIEGGTVVGPDENMPMGRGRGQGQGRRFRGRRRRETN